MASGREETRGLKTVLRRAKKWTSWACFLTMACEGAPQMDGSGGPFLGQVKPVLYVADVEAGAPFFRDILGFEFLGYSDSDGEPHYAEMAAGGLKFGLHKALNPVHGEWIGHQSLYFRVADAADHRTTVLAAGGQAGELLERDWMDMFIVRDPDGHEIVFASTDRSRHSTDPW